MSIHSEPVVSRRDALRVSLASAALLVVAGCQAGGRSIAQLESASKELRKTIEGMSENDVERVRLASIARRLEARSRELLVDYREFQDDFDTLSINRDVSSSELSRMTDEYQARRIAGRNDLLRLQDDLRAELTADEWDEVVDVLNRKAQSIARTPLEKG